MPKLGFSDGLGGFLAKAQALNPKGIGTNRDMDHCPQDVYTLYQQDREVLCLLVKERRDSATAF